MKMFYEKPVVEITKFDEESIMTASAITTVGTQEQQNKAAEDIMSAAVVKNINVAATAATVDDVFGW